MTVLHWQQNRSRPIFHGRSYVSEYYWCTISGMEVGRFRRQSRSACQRVRDSAFLSLICDHVSDCLRYVIKPLPPVFQSGIYIYIYIYIYVCVCVCVCVCMCVSPSQILILLTGPAEFAPTIPTISGHRSRILEWSSKDTIEWHAAADAVTRHDAQRCIRSLSKENSCLHKKLTSKNKKRLYHKLSPFCCRVQSQH